MNRRLQKIILLIIITCIVAGMAGMSQPAMAAGTFRTTDRVNLRTEPSTDADTVSVVDSGTNIEVLDHDPAGWSHVQVGSSAGYIRSDFLKYPTGSSSATFKTTDGVNIRSSASTDSKVLSKVVKGTSVEVTDHDPAGWSKVKVDGVSGFIRSDFLTRGSGASIGGASSAASSSASSTEDAVTTLKTTGSVNLRSGPSTNTDILKALAADTSVEVLENQSNGWSKVRHNDTTGYIRSDLISESGASSSQAAKTLKTTGNVNLRTGPSTNNSIIVTLAPNTSVEVLETQSNGWSKVKHSSKSGYIKSDLLSESGSSGAGSLLYTLTGVNMRSGPSTGHKVIKVLPINTVVEVVENQSNGWSMIRHNGTDGFIKTDFLGKSARVVELIDWATARTIIPKGKDLRVVDVRTGISFTIRAFSLGNHADVDPVTQADTDAMKRSRNGVWSWTQRPVWVTVGDRTFAAAMNGMPHAGSSISGNGLNGHFCLHFRGSTSHTSTSASYVRAFQEAITEAYDKRPR